MTPPPPPRVCVVGSLNMDLVVHASRFPRPGETLLGGPFAQHPGGKGANQAVAAARMRGLAAMVGRVGKPYGEALRRCLEAEHIDITGLQLLDDVATGVGVITIDAEGENSIVVASGANRRVDGDHVRAHEGVITSSQVVLAQLETTLEANRAAFAIGRGAGLLTILNAAPARHLAPEDLADVDVLVVNRIEAAMLTGRDPKESPGDLLAASTELGPDRVVVTLGREGAVASWSGDVVRQASFDVKPVDTVGAGDAFVGCLASALAEERAIDGALARACAAGALATTVHGAIPSMPDRDAVEDLVGRA